MWAFPTATGFHIANVLLHVGLGAALGIVALFIARKESRLGWSTSFSWSEYGCADFESRCGAIGSDDEVPAIGLGHSGYFRSESGAEAEDDGDGAPDKRHRAGGEYGQCGG